MSDETYHCCCSSCDASCPPRLPPLACCCIARSRLHVDGDLFGLKRGLQSSTCRRPSLQSMKHPTPTPAFRTAALHSRHGLILFVYCAGACLPLPPILSLYRSSIWACALCPVQKLACVLSLYHLLAYTRLFFFLLRLLQEEHGGWRPAIGGAAAAGGAGSEGASQKEIWRRGPAALQLRFEEELPYRSGEGEGGGGGSPLTSKLGTRGKHKGSGRTRRTGAERGWSFQAAPRKARKSFRKRESEEERRLRSESKGSIIHPVRDK